MKMPIKKKLKGAKTVNILLQNGNGQFEFEGDTKSMVRENFEKVE